MTNYKVLPVQFGFVLLVAGYLMLAAPTRAAGTSLGDSETISTLLSEAKSEAIELREDADKMDTFMRSKLSWQSFATKINEIRDHVNKTGELLAKLEGVRESGSSWQQQTIDHIRPALKELAANTEATIQHLTDNRTMVHTKQMEDYCHLNYVLAKELAALVGDFIEYGETRARFEELQKEVEGY